MQKLKVNLEKAPTRFEICHQADLFDGFTGTCQRCNNLSLSITKPSLNQINETEMMAMEKEMSPLENLIQNLGQLIESETIVFSLMVLSAILFGLFPEQIGENKGSIKLAICCIGFIISIDTTFFDRVEGPAKAMRIWLMMVTFCSYERLVRLLMEN